MLNLIRFIRLGFKTKYLTVREEFGQRKVVVGRKEKAGISMFRIYQIRL